MILSDWHIHSEFSYDASLPLAALIESARKQGLRKFGVTDHANFNDETQPQLLEHSWLVWPENFDLDNIEAGAQVTVKFLGKEYTNVQVGS